MREILELLEESNIKLYQLDEMFKHNEFYDEAVISLAEAIRALETLDKEVDRISEEYSEAFQFPSKAKEIEHYEDKHGR